MRAQIFPREIHTFQWRWAFCAARQLIALPLSIQQASQREPIHAANLLCHSVHSNPSRGSLDSLISNCPNAYKKTSINSSCIAVRGVPLSVETAVCSATAFTQLSAGKPSPRGQRQCAATKQTPCCQEVCMLYTEIQVFQPLRFRLRFPGCAKSPAHRRRPRVRRADGASSPGTPPQ